eukprot:TRINITY_DN17902_c0_g1_i1.p2 TRINITY_DN17902_c0_g1~~TRINITY_DN17902_c0_g1_i1.p2  ORF type:complete len:284 (+),score=78.29 TRINITY_DN17902_c0_g1_i1:87-938(+)
MFDGVAPQPGGGEEDTLVVSEREKDRRTVEWALQVFSQYTAPAEETKAEGQARALTEDVAASTGYLRQQYEQYAVALQRRQVLGWRMNRVRAESALNVALEEHFGDYGSDLHTLASLRTRRVRRQHDRFAAEEEEDRRRKEEGRGVDPRTMSHLGRITWALGNLETEIQERDARERAAEERKRVAQVHGSAWRSRSLRKGHASPMYTPSRVPDDIDDSPPFVPRRPSERRRSSRWSQRASALPTVSRLRARSSVHLPSVSASPQTPISPQPPADPASSPLRAS